DVHKNILDGLNAGVVSSFRPAEVYFPPYSAAEMHDIYQARILQGVYPNVISGDILDLIVDYSMKIGDLRVGLDLIKRSVMNAENDARTSVTEEDVVRAFSVSKDVHVNETVKTLKNGERQLFELIGQMAKESLEKGDAAGITSGQVQRRAKDELNIGYTYFFEYIKKLEELRLVDLVKKDGVHGRMSYVEMRG
ncbi:MAG: cell division control protein 6, partial [Methanomicrobium sp.]|nr:cell division control protein 6 [Methanomicrobium sp.]